MKRVRLDIKTLLTLSSFLIFCACSSNSKGVSTPIGGEQNPGCQGDACGPEICREQGRQQGDACSIPEASENCRQGILQCTDQGLRCLLEPNEQDEICNAQDDDCDGNIDEDLVGVEDVCNAQDDDCDGAIDEGSAESCNGQDDDCDGIVDEDVARIEEICNGQDEDCDGTVDESPQRVGEACGTLDRGICERGELQCNDGRMRCVSLLEPIAEICDDEDNDCDGDVDEDVAEVGQACESEIEGCVGPGTLDCMRGDLYCVPNQANDAPELCDGLDNNCNGLIDEGFEIELQWQLVPIGAQCIAGVGECESQGIATCGVGGNPAFCDAAVIPAQEELCDGLDNDCDGDVDEDFDMNQNGSPLGAECFVGKGYCENNGAFVCGDRPEDPPQCSVEPYAPELGDWCDGGDDDCDGRVDEFDPESGQPCEYEDNPECNTVGETVCEDGDIRCVSEATSETQEQLCDGIDNDCDGNVDEYNPGGGEVCVDENRFGVCREGMTSCNRRGSELVCSPTQSPSAEQCDALDNDCDGNVDEGIFGEACMTGELGICNPGTMQCELGEMGCVRNQEPDFFEWCDGIDNDCDGNIDEDPQRAGERCTSLENGAQGQCQAGSLECINGALVCEQTGQPTPEICDGIDNDCDGNLEEDEMGNVLSRGCYTGPDGTAGVGNCRSGTQFCNRFERDWSMFCIGQVLPGEERCNERDDDCDGNVDEGDPGGGENCDVPFAQGICISGTLTCMGGALTCMQNQMAQDETCNSQDDDCDGSIDESFPSQQNPCQTGLPGECSAGIRECSEGNVTCVINPDIMTRGPDNDCEGRDNDCDGSIDEHFDANGEGCDANLHQWFSLLETENPNLDVEIQANEDFGDFDRVCVQGTQLCVDEHPRLRCIPIAYTSAQNNPQQSLELQFPQDNLDNDCDGMIDEQ